MGPLLPSQQKNDNGPAASVTFPVIIPDNSAPTRSGLTFVVRAAWILLSCAAARRSLSTYSTGHTRRQGGRGKMSTRIKKAA